MDTLENRVTKLENLTISILTEIVSILTEIERLKVHMSDATKQFNNLTVMAQPSGGRVGTESASKAQRLER